MAKKIFFISLGAFLILLVFWVAYNFTFRNNPNDPAVKSDSKNIIAEVSNTLSDAISPNSTVVVAVNERVIGAATFGGFLYYYSVDDQAIKKSTLEGKDRVTLLSNLPGTPTRLVWSPQKDRVLLNLKAENGTSLWHLAEISTKTLAPLKPEISRIAWDNTGNKILYQYTDPKTGERSINIADPNGSNWKKVVSLGKQDFFLAALPQSSSVLYWTRPNALEKGRLLSVAITGENEKRLITDRLGADFLPAPDGNHILMSSVGDGETSQPALSTLNPSGGELKALSAPSIISKTAWSKDGKTLFYALPNNIPAGSLIPNDYFDRKFLTNDTFWRLDIETGKKNRVVELNEQGRSFDATDLFLSSQEDVLFFVNREDSKVYRIDF